jgi:hypothetical protein
VRSLFLLLSSSRLNANIEHAMMRRTRFLAMARDASFSFSATAPPSIALANPNAPVLSLNLGPVSLNVRQEDRNVIEEGVESVRDGFMDLFGRFKSGVQL